MAEIFAASASTRQVVRFVVGFCGARRLLGGPGGLGQSDSLLVMATGPGAVVGAVNSKVNSM